MGIKVVTTGLEIENPYRYRAYFVGRKPIYDIQNDAFVDPEYDEVREIESRCQVSAGALGWVVRFSSGKMITFADNTANVIEHSEVVEVQNENN